MSDEIEELRKKAIEEAKKKGIKDSEGFSRVVMSHKDPEVLKEIISKIPQLAKWYDSIKIKTDRTGKTTVSKYTKTPEEVGKPLEDLVEIALRELGCEVLPLKTPVIQDDSGLPWVYDKSRKKWVLKLRTINLPSFKEEGKFKDKGVRFARIPNVRNKPDFVGKEIAIEVKNRDPAFPYKTDMLFKKEVLNRFKGVRKRDKYLMIPKGVLTQKQRETLKNRKITVINLKHQLRRNNQTEVYTDVFNRLKKVLAYSYSK